MRSFRKPSRSVRCSVRSGTEFLSEPNQIVRNIYVVEITEHMNRQSEGGYLREQAFERTGMPHAVGVE